MRAFGICFAVLFLAACADEPSHSAPTESAGAASDAQTAGGKSSTAATLPRTDAPTGGRVFFIAPKNGATVSSPVHIEFGAEYVSIVRAGQQAPDAGHHHLIVDAGLPDVNLPIPANTSYIHFGDGSTSTDLDLPPGEHKLMLLLGDHLHIPHVPPVHSEQITITVTK